MSFNINDPAGIQALLNTLRASQAWSQVSNNNLNPTTSEITPAAGAGAIATTITTPRTHHPGPQAPIPAYELLNGNDNRNDDKHGHGNEDDESSMTSEYAPAAASSTAGGVPAIAQTPTHVLQQQNTTETAPPRPHVAPLPPPPPPPPTTTTTTSQLLSVSSAASSSATSSVSALLAQLQSPSPAVPWTLASSIPSSSLSSQPTAETSVRDHLHHYRASAAACPLPSSSSSPLLPDAKSASRGISSSASTRSNAQHNQLAATAGSSAVSITATLPPPSSTVLPDATASVPLSAVDTTSSTTPTRSGQDLRALTFQQALPILLSAIQDPAFVSAVRKLQDEQAQLETKLWREREMIREKFDEKVRVAQNKAKMIGTQITKHEAQILTEAYRKALAKFDRERVLPAWDALMGKQQKALEALSVPTMFETRDRKDCERQKKVMQTLQGLVADDAT